MAGGAYPPDPPLLYDYEYDVVIVGGGISGLYTAWRLGASTHLKVAVLEASNRFGGRFENCLMPGNFVADFGAMRFLPLSHKLLYQLTKDLCLDVERFYNKEDVSKNSHSGYFRNQRVKGLDDFKKLYSIREEDMPYFVPANHKMHVKLPDNGNVYESTVEGTEQLAIDMNQAQYLSLSTNAEVLARGDSHYPLHISVADQVAFLQQYVSSDEANPLTGYHRVKGGMTSIIHKLVTVIKGLPNVTLLANSMVIAVNEVTETFQIKMENQLSLSINAKKMILACNARGIELISWFSPYHRTTHFQRLFSKIEKVTSVKVFLTYKTAWWEDAGLFSGRVETDLPISEVTAFGNRGKNENFATILAAFTYKDTGIFEGLNQPKYKRFVSYAGDVPEELLPSQLLVDYVQKQLQAVFGLKSIPLPVSAATRLWMSDPIAAANYHSRLGVDTYQLQWKTLKPFADASIYIAGDTFIACTKDAGAFIGWSEGALLNSERILVNYFGLNPYYPGIPMHNEFPQVVPAAKL